MSADFMEDDGADDIIRRRMMAKASMNSLTGHGAEEGSAKITIIPPVDVERGIELELTDEGIKKLARECQANLDSPSKKESGREQQKEKYVSEIADDEEDSALSRVIKTPKNYSEDDDGNRRSPRESWATDPRFAPEGSSDEGNGNGKTRKHGKEKTPRKNDRISIHIEKLIIHKFVYGSSSG